MGVQPVLDRLAALAARQGNLRYAQGTLPVRPAQPSAGVAIRPPRPSSPLLFPKSGGAALRPLLSILLPPPPDTASPKTIRAWLAGELHDPLTPVLTLIDPPVDEIMDMEIDRIGRGQASLAVAGARAPCDPAAGREDAAWLEGLPRPQPSDIRPDAVQAFAAGVREVLETFEPATAAALQIYGATLTCGPGLAALLARAQDIEAAWIADEPSVGVTPQDLRGAVSASADLGQPTVLRRAAFLHLLTSRPVASALRDALVETRFAQALARVPDVWITPHEIEALLPLAPAGERLDALLGRLAAAVLAAPDGRGAPLDPQDVFARFVTQAAHLEQSGAKSRREAAREALCGLAAILGVRPEIIVRAWSVTPALAPALRDQGLRLASSDGRAR
jgi:hypothetical protein